MSNLSPVCTAVVLRCLKQVTFASAIDIARVARCMTLVGLVAAALPARSADRIAAGLYRVTSTTSGQSHISDFCMSTTDAQGINGDAATGRAAAQKAGGAECKIKTYDVSGDIVSYTMTCGEAIVVKSRTTYHGDSFEGDLTSGTAGITGTSHTIGKRIGACK